VHWSSLSRPQLDLHWPLDLGDRIGRPRCVRAPAFDESSVSLYPARIRSRAMHASRIPIENLFASVGINPDGIINVRRKL
jgi:hypothetical protein